MKEIIKAIEEHRLIEAFGSGTAAIVSPVELIHYNGQDYQVPIDTQLNAGKLTQRLANDLMDIQYGKKQFKDWSVIVN